MIETSGLKVGLEVKVALDSMVVSEVFSEMTGLGMISMTSFVSPASHSTLQEQGQFWTASSI